jgi:exopolysaccharide biosynthesis predicted pyruvyltransferase EpsI
VIDPEGGLGDQLILLGMEKKLQEMNIHYRLLRIRKSPIANKALARALDSLPSIQRIIRASRPGVIESRIRQLTHLLSKTIASDPKLSEEVILLRGGAYLNDVWKGYGVLRLVANAVRNKPKTIIIVAPQSFYFEETRFPEVLANLREEVHIFCRENESYKLLSSFRYPKNVHIHLSPDTAFYLSRKDLDVRNVRERYILIAPRLDRESATTWRINKIPKSRGTHVVSKDANLLPDFKSFVDIVANACKVYTDRLHVSILAAILNKETYLLPTIYHKNKSVYEFSLKHFRNVKFINAKEFPVPETSNTNRTHH